MRGKLDHMGLVVDNLNEVASLYGKMLGLTPWDKGVLEDTENGVRLLTLNTGNEFFIELIQPTKHDNRFAKLLKERGEGFFHLCFLVENFDKEVSALKEKGFTVEEDVVKTFPGHVFRQAWVPPECTRGVWIELADMAAIPDFLLQSH